MIAQRIGYSPIGRRQYALKGPIQSVEVTYFVHATEDSARLRRAVADLVGSENMPLEERLEGHFGNEILRVRLHLTGDEAESGFEKLASRIPIDVIKQVLADLPSHVDEHSALFLRFDKQSLVRGSVALGSSDPVRVKVKPRGFMMKGGAAAFYNQLLGGK
jgi:RNA binding exosome subunit